MGMKRCSIHLDISERSLTEFQKDIVRSKATTVVILLKGVVEGITLVVAHASSITFMQISLHLRYYGPRKQ